LQLILTWHKRCAEGKMLKQSLYRPGKALKFPGVWDSQISRQLAHEDGKFVSPSHWLPLLYPQEIFLVLISFRGWFDPRAIVRPEGLCQWKIPVTPLGIEPATFWLVVQCLSQLCHCVPLLCMCGKHYCVYSDNARIMDHIKRLGDLFFVGLMMLHPWQSLCGFGRGAERNLSFMNCDCRCGSSE
jgi:hypothetical protein